VVDAEGGAIALFLMETAAVCHGCSLLKMVCCKNTVAALRIDKRRKREIPF